MTYKEVYELSEKLARGLKDLNLCPVIESITEDDREWRFAGIWSQNRWEWNAVFFATQMIKATVVGFYDSMGPDAVDYCFEQTKMTSIFASKKYLQKILNMKRSGQAVKIENIILFDKDEDFEENK